MTNYLSTIRWKRQLSSATTIDNPEKHTEVPKYQSRLIECGICKHQKERRHMQLRTHLGYRGITCTRCHYHARVGRAKCQCGCIWHQCMTHRICSTVHKSTRPSTRIQKGIVETGKKLDSRREAPEVRENAKQHKRKIKAMGRNYLHQHDLLVVVKPVIELNLQLHQRLAAKFPHLAAR